MVLHSQTKSGLSRYFSSSCHPTMEQQRTISSTPLFLILYQKRESQPINRRKKLKSFSKLIWSNSRWKERMLCGAKFGTCFVLYRTYVFEWKMYFRSTRTQCQWQALHVSFLYDLWFSFSFYWTENLGHCDHEQFYWTFFLSFFLFRAVSVSQLYTMFVLCQICAILPQMLSQFLSICVRHYRTKYCFKHPQN